jgi:hypothetical protein
LKSPLEVCPTAEAQNRLPFKNEFPTLLSQICIGEPTARVKNAVQIKEQQSCCRENTISVLAIKALDKTCHARGQALIHGQRDLPAAVTSTGRVKKRVSLPGRGYPCAQWTP